VDHPAAVTVDKMVDDGILKKAIGVLTGND
jgi:hypothetical protein